MTQEAHGYQLPAGASVAQYVSKRWGVPVRALPLRTVAPGVLPSRVVDNNPRRFFYLLVNVSVANIWIGFDSSLTTVNGILLPPSGGSISLSADEDGELTTYECFALTAGAGPNLSVFEVVSI